MAGAVRMPSRSICRPRPSLLVEERKHTPPEEYRAYLAALAPLDACHYIGHAAPSRLFFQFARDDEFVSVKDGERYFELASEPKQIAWYDHCNHAFNAQARLFSLT